MNFVIRQTSIFGGLASAIGAMGLALLPYAAAALVIYQLSKMAADQINKNLSRSRGAQDTIGGAAVRVAAFFGDEQAQMALDRKANSDQKFGSAKNFGVGGGDVPIEIRNIFEIDGQILDERTNKILGKEFNQTNEDLASNNEG